MARKEKNPNQIIRVDGKNCFVEFLNSAFNIEKVEMVFMSYDTKKESGSRCTGRVQLYLSFPEFLGLCNDAKSGKLAKKYIEAVKKEGYPEPLFISMGGTSARALAARGQSRADGKSISRQFKIAPGKVKPYLLTAEQGAGEENQTGLIVPQKGKPEISIMVPVNGEVLVQMLSIVEMHINAFITAQYLELGTANVRRQQENSPEPAYGGGDYPQEPPANYGYNYGNSSTRTA